MLIDIVIQLEQVIDGHRLWWTAEYWHCDCPDWSSCDCSHTLKAAEVFTITSRLVPVSSSSPDLRCRRRRRRSLH